MSSMLDAFLPTPHVLQRQRVPVVAEPPQALRALRCLDLGSLPELEPTLGLFAWPRHLVAQREVPPEAGSWVEQLTGRDGDFRLLADEASRGLVVGIVGRFWHPPVEVQHLAPEEDFKGFDVPGFGKVVCGLSVDKRRSGGSWVTFELRVGLTDPDSERAFDLAWPVLRPLGEALQRAVLRLVERDLDAVDPAWVALPGDLLIPAKSSKTSGVVVEAKVSTVWPWVLELADRRSASAPDLEVLSLEAEHALVLCVHGPGRRPSLTWALVLEPIGEDACWLGTRVRTDVPERPEHNVFSVDFEMLTQQVVSESRGAMGNV